MPAKKRTQKPAKSTRATGKQAAGFTEEERAAMKERARELKAGKANGESAVLAKIAAMPDSDRVLGERLHEIIKASAPDLEPRLWYGMPAYAREGKVICFFQNAASDKANLDDGSMWPTAFALTEMTPVEEARIAALVKKSVN